MKLLIVGSVALDTIETPFGSASEVLGGSATYASLAARLFLEPCPVAVVGTDFPQSHLKRLESLGIFTHGIYRHEGRTFRWHGRYEADDLNTAITVSTELNVFRTFEPCLSTQMRGITDALLANIDPELQWSVLQQLWGPRCVGIDSMGFWIHAKRDALKRVMARAHVVFLNEAEAKLLSKRQSLVDAMKALVSSPAQAIVVKRGEYGCACLYQGRLLTFPAFLLPRVVDPTGAGDAFAGAMMGSIARGGGRLSIKSLKEALRWATVVASFAIEQIGTGGLTRLALAQGRQRLNEFLRRGS